MDTIMHPTGWYLSAEGVKAYESLSSLEERTLFLYRYLRTVANDSFEKDNALMRIAFLLAEGVANRAGVAYKAYPALITAEANPLVAYLKNAKKYPGRKALYVVLMAVLQGKADPANTGLWIYNDAVLGKSDLADWLKEQGLGYLPDKYNALVDKSVYAIDDALSYTQSVLMWLFLEGGQG